MPTKEVSEAWGMECNSTREIAVTGQIHLKTDWKEPEPELDGEN